MKKAAVVIPVYQNELNTTEYVSLLACKKVLANYPVIFVAPEGLIPSYFSEIPNAQVIYFDEKYFKSPKTYNQLMVSIAFYQHFKAFDYILIYQLDAFVFEDKLLQWCEKGYDYIGAPQLSTEHFVNPCLKNGLNNPIVFNGGFSLRKVSSFIRLLKIYHLFYSQWPGNEDALFSFQLRRARPLRFLFKLPSWQTALLFAIEENPEKCFELNGKQLPFGCHAWEKYNPAFWSQFIG